MREAIRNERCGTDPMNGFPEDANITVDFAAIARDPDLYIDTSRLPPDPVSPDRRLIFVPTDSMQKPHVIAWRGHILDSHTRQIHSAARFRFKRQPEPVDAAAEAPSPIPDPPPAQAKKGKGKRAPSTPATRKATPALTTARPATKGGVTAHATKATSADAAPAEKKKSRPQPRPRFKAPTPPEVVTIESESESGDAEPVVRKLRSTKEVALRRLSRGEVEAFEMQDEARESDASSSAEDEAVVPSVSAKKGKRGSQKRVRIVESDAEDDNQPTTAAQPAKGVGPSAPRGGQIQWASPEKNMQATGGPKTWVLMDASFYECKRQFNKAVPLFDSEEVSDGSNISDGRFEFWDDTFFGPSTWDASNRSSHV